MQSTERSTVRRSHRIAAAAAAARKRKGDEIKCAETKRRRRLSPTRCIENARDGGTEKKKREKRKRKRVEDEENDQGSCKRSTSDRDAAEAESVWKTLPDELRIRVFASFVSHPHTLATCMLVCRSWARIAGDNVLWQETARAHSVDLAANLVARLVDPNEALSDLRSAVREVAACAVCHGTLTRGRRAYPFWDSEGIVRQDIVPVYLCLECLASDNVVAKTAARKEYALTEADLAAVPHVMVSGNPCSGRPSSKFLYVRRFLCAVSHRKHGGTDGLAAKKERNAAIAGKRRATLAERRTALDQERVAAQEARKEREARLVAALRERGLVRRGDSRVCNEYVATGHRDLELVVDTMDEMRFYHTRTDYIQHIKRIKDEYRESYQWWEHDEVSAKAKRRALAQWLKTQIKNRAHPDDIRARLPKSMRGIEIPHD